jgi:hypothetical protein
VICHRYRCTVPPLRWQGRATATILRTGKEDAAPLQTSGEAERGSSMSTGAALDGRWCWGRRLGASVVLSDGESRRSARVAHPGHGGRSTVPQPHPRRVPWPVPPRPHVTSPEHRCRRTRVLPRPSAASSSRRCRVVPPCPSTRRRKRLGRASRRRKKEDAERTRG